jgi:hypothetical protein
MTAITLPDLQGQCYACTKYQAGGLFNLYCPSDGRCYNNATAENPNKFTIPCNSFLIDSADQCLAIPEFQSELCDQIYFYNSSRERYTIYDQVFSLAPQTGCQFKLNGTRTFIQFDHGPDITAYFAKSDALPISLIVDPEDTDPDGTYASVVYFKNSRVIITSSGDVLAERTNYLNYIIINYGKDV